MNLTITDSPKIDLGMPHDFMEESKETEEVEKGFQSGGTGDFSLLDKLAKKHENTPSDKLNTVTE